MPRWPPFLGWTAALLARLLALVPARGARRPRSTRRGPSATSSPATACRRPRRRRCASTPRRAAAIVHELEPPNPAFRPAADRPGPVRSVPRPRSGQVALGPRPARPGPRLALGFTARARHVAARWRPTSCRPRTFDFQRLRRQRRLDGEASGTATSAGRRTTARAAAALLHRPGVTAMSRASASSWRARRRGHPTGGRRARRHRHQPAALRQRARRGEPDVDPDQRAAPLPRRAAPGRPAGGLQPDHRAAAVGPARAAARPAGPAAGRPTSSPSTRSPRST